MKKELNAKMRQPSLLRQNAPRQKGRKRTFAATFSSLLLLGNLFASHQHADAAPLRDLNAYAQPQKQRPAAPQAAAPAEQQDNEQDNEKVAALWSAAAIIARPLLFEHEDCDLFQGRKKTGNFGVFWPRRVNLPADSAFRRYVNSEKQKVAYIVERLGAGPEKNLTLFQMAQVYSFVHNTSVASGDRALAALKRGGMRAAQAVMSRVDRIKGMKAPLPGLAQRRKDEVKLGAGDMDAPISRLMSGGRHHTLASLQAHYNDFVTGLGENTSDKKSQNDPRTHADLTAPERPSIGRDDVHHAGAKPADGVAADPI